MKKFIAALGIITLMFSLTACGGSSNQSSGSSGGDSQGQAVTSTPAPTEEADSSSSESVSEPDETTTEGTDSAFSPVDTSDASIESIVTYGDYLTMYRMVTDEYLANYESAMKSADIYDEDSFREVADEAEATYKEQEDAYASVKDQALPDKESYVDYLKFLRDTLQETIDIFSDF